MDMAPPLHIPNSFEIKWRKSRPNGLALQQRAKYVCCKRLLGGGPGIVGAEVPNVPFGIPARVVPASVVLVPDFNHDLRARRDSSCVVLVGVVDDDVRALRNDATQSARRLLNIVELARARGAEHYHSVPEDELCVDDRAVFTWHDKVLLESERLAEPRDGCRCVVVPHGRNHRRRCGLCFVCQCLSPV